ncbi:MAG: rubredoxin-like domain-containing protein [Candidatus Hermodarchaeota archaeon]
MNIFRLEQYVCEICGYNMIGYLPDNCPFCGSPKKKFITAEFCSKKYSIKKEKVTNRVFSLRSSPKLGLEHLAYCIVSDNQKIWIDCPSTFQASLDRMDKILFTHHHFLGASNLYRSYYTAFIWIHQYDTQNNLAQNHSFDKLFLKDFELGGIEAFHINGHTQGFTFYIFENVLFVCDYVFLIKESMRLNPYGPNKETFHGALKIKDIIKNKDLRKVCGYNYIDDYSDWKKKFEELLARTNF